MNTTVTIALSDLSALYQQATTAATLQAEIESLRSVAPVAETAKAEPVGNRWIEWRGGACPVHRDTKIFVRYRKNEVASGTAGLCDWRHDGSDLDIVAYHVVKSVPQP